MYLLHMFGVIIAVMQSSSSSSSSSDTPVEAAHCFSAVHMDTTIFTATKTLPTWDLNFFLQWSHILRQSFLWEIMLPTDSKIFTATKTPPTWDLEFFPMITHFEAVFFVGNNASNR